MSLAARLMNRMKIGLANQNFVVESAPTPVLAPAPVTATGGGIKRVPKAKVVDASPEKPDEDYSAVAFAASYSPGTPIDKPAKKAKAVTKKPTAAATKKSAVPVTKKMASKKKASYDSDGDEDMFDGGDSDDDDSISGNTPVAPRAMPGRARKAIVYDAGDNSDDDDDDEGVFDDESEDDDESDFE